MSYGPRIAVLGPGGVGGFLAGALARAGEDVVLVAREETAATIARDGLRIESVRLGDFEVFPRTVTELAEPIDVLVVAVKAPALDAALERVAAAPGLVVPLLNGVEHLAALRRRYGERAVAGSIRIAAERIEPGRIVHTSPAFRVELAPAEPAVEAFVHRLRAAEIPAKLLDSEADVLWSKLARLAPLALSTAAAAGPIGAVWGNPHRRVLLEDAVAQTAAVAVAEGTSADTARTLEELIALDPSHTSSLQRDLAAGAPVNELDAIGGAVLRAAARHGVEAPAIEALIAQVRDRYPHA